MYVSLEKYPTNFERFDPRDHVRIHARIRLIGESVPDDKSFPSCRRCPIENSDRATEVSFNPDRPVDVLSKFKRAATLTDQFSRRVLARARACSLAHYVEHRCFVSGRTGTTAKRNNETANRRVLRARGVTPSLSLPFPLSRSSSATPSRTRM